MGKQNICRPVIFYNNFLPPVKDVQEWQYCAWGIWDGIDVGNNIASDGEGILGKIWEYQKGFCKQMEGKYTAQIVYAMKYDEVLCDEEFWSEKQDKDYPFTFFVRIQLKENIEKLWEDRLDVQRSIERRGRVIVNTYLTYDNFDLLVVLKTGTYEAGADIIHGFYQRNGLGLDAERPYMVKNSFSVFAMKQGIINQTGKNNITGLLDEVDVRMIERRGGGIAAIEKLLKECPKSILNNSNCIRKQILGVEDGIISFKGIPWDNFLSLYKDKEGIFNNANRYYQNYLLGTTTIFAQSASLCSVDEKNDEEGDIVEAAGYSQYIEKIRARLRNLKESRNSDLCKELDVIVNVLSKFEQPVFSDYVFLTIMRPLDCLLDLSLMNAERGKGAVIDSRQVLFGFVKSLNMYTQNAIGSDRNSIQTMDINDKIYAVPVKLNAFYNAYIFQVCGLLNRSIKEEGKEKEEIPVVEYNFLAMPGIADRVCVIELYKRVCEERRLIKVEIPEQKYYDPKGMMIILAHEVAHYVGRDLREREKRYRSFLQATAHIYICYVLQQYKYNRDEDIYTLDENIYSELEERMTSILEIVLEREVNWDYLKNEKNDTESIEGADIEEAQKENKKYQFYISFIKKFMAGALATIVDVGMKDVFAPVLYPMNEKEKKDFLEQADEATKKFEYWYEEGSTLLSLSTMMERLIMIYEECFADLMSIMLLRMTPYDYFNCLLEEGLEQGIAEGDSAKYDYTFRALLVTLCMLRQEDEPYIYVWSEDDVIRAEEQERCRDFVDEIGILYKTYYIEEKKIYNTRDYDRNCVNIFKDKKVIKNIVDYLRECRKKYALMEQQNKDDEKGTIMTQKVRNLYKRSWDGIDENGLEFLMMEQQKFIEDYKKDLISV